MQCLCIVVSLETTTTLRLVTASAHARRRRIETFLTKKKFKDFFNKNIAAL
jgi:hypothetical protein